MKFVHTALDMSLNKTLSIAGLSFSLVGFASADVESSISAGYNSDYIYRGVNLGADQVSLGIDASGSAAGLDWNVGLFHGTSQGGLVSQDERRISAGITKAIQESVDFNAGLISTSYVGGPFANGDRLEVYTGLSTTIACIDLSATAFFNTTDAYTGDVYYEISASYSVDVADNVSATLGASYGNWDEDPLALGLDDVDFVSLSAALNISLDNNTSASVGVTHVITDTAVTEDETVIGASLSFGL